MTSNILPCPICGADEGSTYLGEPGPGVVRCFAVGCDAVVSGYATDDEAVDEWNRRSAAMDAAMTEAYCTNNDLTECFRHHVETTIGWQAFGARPGREMQMYEEGFKAGYRRCQSDNEPELGEADVRVIQLPWHKEPDGDFWRAEVIGHVYEVHDDEMADYKKRQCQYDFEAGIRSAIVEDSTR